jgi:tRNA-Thr(GGU) m(6)t(6)A37 methyltransferase TsaA
MKVCFAPIGVIRSPFKETANVPIQPAAATGIRGSVEVNPEYEAGLRDLDGFSHIILVYYFHLVTRSKLEVIPFLDQEPRGIFATRAPVRPNPIGLSVVRLRGKEGNTLQVENVDIVDGTPLLDIKPYVPEFDIHQVEHTGWLASTRGKAQHTKSDSRFD